MVLPQNISSHASFHVLFNCTYYPKSNLIKRQVLSTYSTRSVPLLLAVGSVRVSEVADDTIVVQIPSAVDVISAAGTIS